MVRIITEKPVVECGFLKKKEVAVLLNVSPRTVNLWMAENGLPFLRVGSMCRFDRSKVLAWFNGFARKCGNWTSDKADKESEG